jgi:hypothetical protein
LTIDSTGKASFTLTNLAVGNYDFRIKVPEYLSKKISNIALTNSVQLNFSSLLAGDLNNDNIVNSLDFAILSGKWLTADPTADINKDGIVNSLDFSLLSANWLVQGQ